MEHENGVRAVLRVLKDAQLASLMIDGDKFAIHREMLDRFLRLQYSGMLLCNHVNSLQSDLNHYREMPRTKAQNK
jgi:hypothetical protein